MPWPVLDGEHCWFQDGHLQDGLGGEGPVNIRHTPMTPLVSAEVGMADSCKNTAEISWPLDGASLLLLDASPVSVLPPGLFRRSATSVSLLEHCFRFVYPPRPVFSL
jgi:hypothetical protein